MRQLGAAPWLSPEQQTVLRAVAESTLPAGVRLPAAGQRTVERVMTDLAKLSPAFRQFIRLELELLAAQAWLGHGTSFSAAPSSARREMLAGWHRHEATRLLARALLAPLKLAHFGSPEVYAALELRHTPPPTAHLAQPRWLEQISPVHRFGNDAEFEAEVVIVGTGAGGAPVAAALAERGVAVLMLEEGEWHDRRAFTGRPVEMMARLYRHPAGTLAFGNTVIPIPLGKAVGGTTLINSGTCLRPSDTVLRGFAARGLTALSPAALQPYFEQVDRALEIAPSSGEALGATARLIARGADALGWSHHPLPRNAPGCDGQSLCCFGCPTDAKRSTNLSFVPRALKRGAQLLTGARVTELWLDGDRVVGVRGCSRDPDGRQLSFRVRASIVVLACGALHTPALLLRQGLANGSGQLGRKLSIHPATAGLGLMAEPVHGSRSVPQGYGVDQFAAEGIYFEGAGGPVELFAAALPAFGDELVSLVESFAESLVFGFMIKDRPRGRVWPSRSGEPRVAYWLGDEELARLQRGYVLLARLLFAAGAREVLLPVAGWERLAAAGRIADLERASLRARQLDLSAYHPLGTAGMGLDPFDSVVNIEQETHDLLNLYICDGAVIPGSLGANPQVMIMAMSLRAAEGIARRLEQLARCTARGMRPAAVEIPSGSTGGSTG